MLVRLLATVIAAVFVAPPLNATPEPDLSKVLRFHSRFSAAHGCPVAPRLAFTAAHVVDEQPFDKSVSLFGGRFENMRSTAAGRYQPIFATSDEDFAVVELNADVPYYRVATKPPKPGDRLYWLAYNFSARKSAYAPKPYVGTVALVYAGTVIVEDDTVQGSSGSCVLNAAGEVVGVISFGMEMAKGGEITGIVGVWEPWVDSPEKIIAGIAETRQ